VLLASLISSLGQSGGANLTITVQPQSQTVPASASVTFSVSVTGAGPYSYQWQLDGTNLPNLITTVAGDGTAGYSGDGGPATNAGLNGPWGLAADGSGNLFIADRDDERIREVSTNGIITTVAGNGVSGFSGDGGPATNASCSWPLGVALDASGNLSFGVIASGFPAPTSYQWTLNGTNLTGAISNTFTINHVGLSNLGSYQVLVGNGYSSTNSDIATLNMSPSITSPFLGATTIWGRSAVLSVGAIGSGELSYQWYMNGTAIDGATNATLDFTSIQFTNGGLYSVVVSSAFGIVTNVAAQVVVNPADVSLGFSPTLTISGEAGYSYIIQSSTNLTDTNAWVTLTNLTLTQPVQIWVDTNVDASSPFNPKYFYQVLPGQ